MLVDWVTVAAQIVNFVILVVVLERFLYRPILKVMAEREQAIRSRLLEASDRTREAEQEADLYRQQQQEFDRQRQVMLDRARQQADTQRQIWLQQAEADVDERRARWHEGLVREQQTLLHHFSQQVGEQAIAATQHALETLADRTLEAQIVTVFIEQLQKLDSGLADLASSLRDRPDEPMTIVSSFDLDSDSRDRLQAALNERLGTTVEIAFITDAAPIAGIELRTAGYRLAWSLADYLANLHNRFKAELERSGIAAPASPNGEASSIASLADLGERS